ncbi:MAG TPA: DUF1028 domain-containing protein [Bryobacteraceae bacterium]|jgi:uncharacterized Ntn-hydrolase superfamily protein
MRIAAFLLIAVAVEAQVPAPRLPLPNVATFSIVAYDKDAGEWGVTVASRYFSVGSVVPWAEAGVGAIATQANVNVGYGPRGLELLRQGLNAKQVLERLQSEDKFDGRDGRQVAIIDAEGGIAAYTGPAANAWAGDKQGKTWSAQGNILVGPQVVEAMGKAFEAASGDLAEKLYAALKAGDDAGGDSRGKQSASMLVVRKGGGRNTNNDRPIYLNVDDNPTPLVELRRLLNMNQAILYQDRAFKAFNAGRKVEARRLAGVMVKFQPDNVQSRMTLGLFSYFAGDKDAAVAELKRAAELDPHFRATFEKSVRGRRAFDAILEDADFMRRLFQ